MNAITNVTKLLDSGAVWAGDPFHRGPISLIPLFHDFPQAGYVRFGELPDGSVTVTEIDASGHVPELLVANSSSRPVLFLEGEVLVGLKQDRTLNVTVLVPAHSRVHLPVACVEQGRWGHTTTYAGRSDHNLPPSARYLKSESTQRSARDGGSFRSDQGAVWQSVERELSERGIHSESSAYRDAATAPPDPRLASLLDLEPETDQRGVFAFVGGRPVAADLFDRPDTLAGSWGGLIRSYASDARRARTMGRRVGSAEALDILAGLGQGEATEHAGVGAGSIVQMSTSDAVVSALVADGSVIHVAALWNPNQGIQSPPDLRTRRPSRRTAWQDTLGTDRDDRTQGGQP